MSISEDKNNIQPNKIIVFQGTEVRRAWHNKEWYYSLVDIVAVLTDSGNPTDYLKKIRKRDEELKSYIGTNCPQVAMETPSGKKRNTLAGNTKNVFRLIQSIPSEKEIGRSVISDKNNLGPDNQLELGYEGD